MDVKMFVRAALKLFNQNMGKRLYTDVEVAYTGTANIMEVENKAEAAYDFALTVVLDALVLNKNMQDMQLDSSKVGISLNEFKYMQGMQCSSSKAAMVIKSVICITSYLDYEAQDDWLDYDSEIPDLGADVK